ncbi:DEAD/DEAH box helicase [Leuconostoc falkenbergense]|uniref:DEAD/DEAH box helicase n=1 Tax=Leuconostoc falkenbergense TaxID=2766470 RepID=UPI0021A9D36E|nr:DEAD/DEAH box helicase [Leuconostoc falkenbergense]MCT4378162.1 DEAD/DEAH box helicase [Leuconostoc falkenbergense]
MTNGTIIQRMNYRAVNDPYLRKLLKKVQLNFGYKLFGKEIDNFSEDEYVAILRFSDILSRSEISVNRNMSLKIIASLYEDYKEDDFFRLVSKSVLVKLGNFPSLKFIKEDGNDIENAEFEADEFVKKYFQKTSSNEYFTDAQYEIFRRITNANHFSFSAGTSFGKSFLLGEYVKWLIKTSNNSESIAFLVPTRALISQVSSDLNDILEGTGYRIISSPEVPNLFRNSNFIFVLTPERLISYFENDQNPKISTIILDEAHNSIADDERAPLFYHAITLAKSKSIKLFFSSPNVSNPEIFLQLVGNSSDESKPIKDLNVVQNRYFLDLMGNKVKIFYDFIDDVDEFDFLFSSMSETIKQFSNTHQSLIYCNSVNAVIEAAQEMACTIDEISSDEEILELSDYIKTNVHEYYFLSELILKGIGFHFGGLPQVLRMKLEEQYKKGNIQFLYTTSTLLQGVNLPAKNIFILTEKIGQNKTLTSMDFRNLIGRAGRLTNELFGNIFVVKNSTDRWSGESQNLLKDREPQKLESFILNGKENFYKNIGNIIESKPMTNKHMTKRKKAEITSYSTILAFQQKRGIDSILVKNFSQKNKTANVILSKLDKLNVSDEILLTSTTINSVLQQRIIDRNDHFEIQTAVDYESCLRTLQQLSNIYQWEEIEDGNHLGKTAKLPYYAVLMTEWMNSKPLNLIIKNAIKYMTASKYLVSINNNPRNVDEFEESNPKHVNIIVNDLMRDLDNIIRFKIKNYTVNYLKLTKQDDSDWQNYLEYGTNDNFIIELQKLGFERQGAIEISKKGRNAFSLNENLEIEQIDLKSLNELQLSREVNQQLDQLKFL